MPDRLLLVIGTQCKELQPPLTFLPEAARALFEVMTDPERGGCRPVHASRGLLLNPTGARLVRTVQAAFEEAGEAEAVLVLAYIGHGQMLDDEFFLLPVDGRHPPLEFLGGVNIVQLVKNLTARSPRHPAGLLVLLDACYAGIAAEGAASRWSSILPGSLRFELLAAAGDRRAFSGCFTQTLTDIVRQGLDSVDGALLHPRHVIKELRRRCPKQAPQHPSFNAHDDLFLAANQAWDESRRLPAIVAGQVARLTDAFHPTDVLSRLVQAMADARIVALVGPTGRGKSTALAALARPKVTQGRVQRGFLHALLLGGAMTTPDVLAQDLADQLTRSLSAFGEARERAEDVLAQQLAEQRTRKADGDPASLTRSAFERRVLAPLRLLAPTPVRIGLDDIDQLSTGARAVLEEALRAVADAPDLAHVRIVVTSLPGGDVPPQARVTELPAVDAADLRAWLRGRAMTAPLVRAIVTRANGNWLVARMLVDAANAHTASNTAPDIDAAPGVDPAPGVDNAPVVDTVAGLDAVAGVDTVSNATSNAASSTATTAATPAATNAATRLALPASLANAYNRMLLTIEAGVGDERWRKELTPLLRLLSVGGSGPVMPLSLLIEASRRCGGAADPAVVDAALVAMRDIVVRGRTEAGVETVGLFHDTLAEYLLDPRYPRVQVERADAVRVLLAAIAALAPASPRRAHDPVYRYAVAREAELCWSIDDCDGLLASLEERQFEEPRDTVVALSSWLQRLKGRLPPNDRRVLALRSLIEHVLGSIGRPATALARLTELAELQARELGPLHHDTLRTRGRVAHWLGRRGQPGDAAAAVKAFEELVPLRTQVLGPHHRETLDARAHIAMMTGQQGGEANAERARAAFETLVPEYEHTLGTEHDETLTARGNLAHWTGASGNPQAALDQIQAMLPVLERMKGHAHPETLRSRNNEAYYLDKVGRVAEARDRFQALYADALSTLGKHVDLTLAVSMHLARLTGVNGDPAAAAQRFGEAVERTTLVFGDTHTYTWHARRGLAEWTVKSGRADEGFALLKAIEADAVAAHADQELALTRKLADRLTTSSTPPQSPVPPASS